MLNRYGRTLYQGSGQHSAAITPTKTNANVKRQQRASHLHKWHQSSINDTVIADDNATNRPDTSLGLNPTPTLTTVTNERLV